MKGATGHPASVSSESVDEKYEEDTEVEPEMEAEVEAKVEPDRSMVSSDQVASSFSIWWLSLCFVNLN